MIGGPNPQITSKTRSVFFFFLSPIEQAVLVPSCRPSIVTFDVINAQKR